MRLKTTIVILFIVSVLILGGSLSKVGQLKLAYNMESFFDVNDKEVQFYQSFKEEFENENDYLLIAISNQEGLDDLEFWHKVDNLTEELMADSIVNEVISPSKAKRKIKLPFVGIFNNPIVDYNASEDSLQIYQRAKAIDDMYSTLFSDDEQTIKLIINLKSNLDQKTGVDWVNSMKESLAKYDFDHFEVAGRLVTQEYYLRTMNKEMIWFTLAAFLIILITLFILLRSTTYSLLTVLILTGTILSTLAVIQYLGYQLDLIMIILPAILLIIGTSASIHVFNELNAHREGSASILEAIRNTFSSVGTPILLNLLTTAGGFAALAFIPIAPIQKFGLFTALGVAILPIFIVGIGAMGSIILNPKYVVRKRGETNKLLFVLGNKITYFSLLAVPALGIISLSFNSVSNKFLEDLNEKSELKKSLTFFEEKFNGIRPLEVIVKLTKDQSLEDPALLKRLKSIEQSIKKNYGISHVYSPLDVIRSVNYGLHEGNPAYYQLPSDSNDLKKVIKTVGKYELLEKLNFSIGNSMFRFSGRTKDLGSENLFRMNDKIISENLTVSESLVISFTGMAHLMDKTNQELSKHLIKGLLLGLSIAFISVFIITKSIRLSLISIVPNLIPLLFVSLLFWITGTNINIGTAIVFSIVFGLAVDDTMHFIYRYNKYRQSLANAYAIHETVNHLKGPMTQTSLILGLGFITFAWSSFQSISMIGISVGLALFIALLADLIILPKLMLYWMKDG